MVAADVYARDPHTGRGGWSWYTGSAAWFFQVALRGVIGLRTVADDGVRYLAIDPCIPKDWGHYEVTYRFGRSTYAISVENPRGVNRGVSHITVDGARIEGTRIPLADDGAVHTVIVAMLGA